MEMMIFYYLHYSDEKEYKPYGVAYSPKEVDLFVIPESGTKVTDWEKIKLQLKEGDFADYLANDLGGRLCSSKMRKIINDNISIEDKIQWLEVSVIEGDKDERTYYALHFPVSIDILNKGKSIITDDGLVVKPILDKTAVKDLNIFTLPNESGITTFVSKKIKEALEKAGCTGLSFTKASTK
jgi:hypothetical protein